MLGQILFVGAGAMGGAILRGALQAGLLEPKQVQVLVRTEASAHALRTELGVNASVEMPNLSKLNTIIWAVKPQVWPQVVPQFQAIPAGTTCLSVAAGINLATLETALPQASWYRAMPNTPVAVGAGLTAVSVGTKGTDEATEAFTKLFGAIGEAVVVSEADLERLTAVSGSGPGYAFVIMDALADAGVRLGLTRSLAIKAAAYTLFGAGKMALETGTHPAILRDQVTSPGGTTIAGIAAMEKVGLRTAMQEGVVACYERSFELSKK
ncbi:pyrroline-5-carboxylate reductase [Veillonella criceti]|uniref:Pyrroline-5-carboxylate reductase n=1 Tax=Veillonella criceti TaxID=103891 RepID=A0A380NKJ4_9FIRM|nr:pyrroline-5-carboxylate reductase [Veillonella criceti]SUP42948.1 Pyrroline-5-carboxylate reductase [Veillonella criceti]